MKFLLYLKGLFFLVRRGNPILSSLRSYVEGKIEFDRAARLTNSRVSGLVKLAEGVKIFSANISGEVEIGRYSSLFGPNLAVHSKLGSISIGSFCSLAPGVQIIEYNHRLDGVTSYYYHQNILGESVVKDLTSKGDVVIGNDVWVGANSVILSGVKIGNGAVVCAGSVVVNDVLPYSIVGGVPARHLRYRHSPEVISQLEDTAWWDWDIKRIKSSREFFEQTFS